METDWIDVCKAGTFTAKNGQDVTLTREDLDAIAAGYNPGIREAPLVFGHPDTDHPAFGWASSWRTVREQRDGVMEHVLQARFRQVPQEVVDLVRQGHFKKVSLSLMPDKRTVRHVGLLGAAQPAVPGLKSVSMGSAENAIDIELANPAGPGPHTKTQEENMPKTVEQLELELAAEKEKTKALTDEVAKLKTDLSAAGDKAKTLETTLDTERKAGRNKAIESRLDKLVSDGRLLPADKPAKLMVALSLAGDSEEIELSEGSGKKSKLEHFLADLEKAPKQDGLFTEFSAPAGDDGKGTKLPTDLTMRV